MRETRRVTDWEWTKKGVLSQRPGRPAARTPGVDARGTGSLRPGKLHSRGRGDTVTAQEEQMLWLPLSSCLPGEKETFNPLHQDAGASRREHGERRPGRRGCSLNKYPGQSHGGSRAKVDSSHIEGRRRRSCRAVCCYKGQCLSPRCEGSITVCGTLTHSHKAMGPGLLLPSSSALQDP